MVRIVTLNVNHRTHEKPMPVDLVEALLALAPDILVLTEYVEGTGRRDFLAALAMDGMEYVAVSDSVACERRTWHNQVLIASRDTIERRRAPRPAPDLCGDTNLLSVQTFGMTVTGLRAPAYKLRSDWYAYWQWLSSVIDGDVVVGDFNADPTRPGKKDRVLAELETAGGWNRAEPDGEWSYCGKNGNGSRIDHALVRGELIITSARYIDKPFAPDLTDHAALVLEVIDHIAHTHDLIATDVYGWPGEDDIHGRLSDHSGVAARIEPTAGEALPTPRSSTR